MTKPNTIKTISENISLHQMANLRHGVIFLTQVANALGIKEIRRPLGMIADIVIKIEKEIAKTYMKDTDIYVTDLEKMLKVEDKNNS